MTGDGYRLRFGAWTWDSSDFTAGQAVTVGTMMGGDRWIEPRDGPGALVTWLSVLIASTSGADLATVFVEVNRLTLPDLLACVEVT